MQFRRGLVALATAMVVAAPALATDWLYQQRFTYNPNYVPPQPAVDVRICAYPMGSSASNHCPGNLIPVMVGGQVSCGVPNAGVCSTYSAPVRVVQRQPAPRRVVCPVGEKGCITK